MRPANTATFLSQPGARTPSPGRYVALASAFALSAALTFLLVDCEATAFGLHVQDCEAPRILTARAASLCPVVTAARELDFVGVRGAAAGSEAAS